MFFLIFRLLGFGVKRSGVAHTRSQWRFSKSSSTGETETLFTSHLALKSGEGKLSEHATSRKREKTQRGKECEWRKKDGVVQSAFPTCQKHAHRCASSRGRRRSFKTRTEQRAGGKKKLRIKKYSRLNTTIISTMTTNSQNHFTIIILMQWDAAPLDRSRHAQLVLLHSSCAAPVWLTTVWRDRMQTKTHTHVHTCAGQDTVSGIRPRPPRP